MKALFTVKKLEYGFRHFLIAFCMATSITALMQGTSFDIIQAQILGIPLFFFAMLVLCAFIATDVRLSFQKVLWYEKREDKRPIWQVGIGMLFFFAQVGAVEVFFRSLMPFNLGGMPLYIIFSFMNAFLLTVIYEEFFYKEETTNSYKFKKLE